MTKFLHLVRSFFFKKENGKEVLNRQRTLLSCGFFLSLGVFVVIFFGPENDSSVILETSEPIKSERIENPPPELSGTVSGLLNTSRRKELEQQSRKTPPPERSRYVQNIEYKAIQVIERKGADSLSHGLPVGSNMVGKLLTTIDTRETNQLYKVLLPYGGQDRNGGDIPKNTILFGKVSYPGKGKKIFIKFSKALLPDGQEVELNAQALDSKEYSPGLLGQFHGRTMERVASTLGLTMASVMTDTLTEREAIGGGVSNGGIMAMEATPKATAKNALLQGLSKVSEMEAQRQANELANQQEYVTVPAGQEMIVNLVSTYYGR